MCKCWQMRYYHVVSDDNVTHQDFRSGWQAINSRFLKKGKKNEWRSHILSASYSSQHDTLLPTHIDTHLYTYTYREIFSLFPLRPTRRRLWNVSIYTSVWIFVYREWEKKCETFNQLLGLSGVRYWDIQLSNICSIDHYRYNSERKLSSTQSQK